MTQVNIKKPSIKFLGIQELISEYQNHSNKMSLKKTGAVPQKNNNRVQSLLELCTKNNSNPRKQSKNQQEIQELNRIYKNKSVQLNHPYNLHTQVHNNPKKQPFLKESNQKSYKNTFSSINFIKKQPLKQNQSNRKISIKNQKKIFSHPNSLISSQTLVRFPSKSKDETKKCIKEAKNKSYLSLKGKDINETKIIKEKDVEINLQDCTLAGINKKIQQFQKKSFKKQYPTEFRKTTKPITTQKDKGNEKMIKTLRVSQMIENQNQSLPKQKQFVSIDTNYYGFSFRNKVPVTKKQVRIQEQKQQISTLDKSGQIQKNSETISQSKGRKISNSTAKIESTKKPYATLNNRYQSTCLIKNKMMNSSIMMKPKKLLKDRYQLTKVIGRGMSGQVYQAKDILSDRFVVIKEIDVNSIQYEFFRQVSHKNIIKYYNNFVQNGKRYLVLEYFPMTLKQLLKDGKKNIQLTDQDLRHIFRSVVNGLAYLHSLSIAHRDIKLDNIVISESLNQIKFIDFGLCLDLSKLQKDLSKQFCGTLSYLPPQIIQGKPHQPKKADIWSLGVVLYALSLGRLPFKGKNQTQILNKICRGKLVFPEGYDSQLRQLIDLMLEKNPQKRCSVSQIMSHPWLN